jgi:hypothetical protein
LLVSLDLDAAIAEAFATHPHPGDDRLIPDREGCRGSEAQEVWQQVQGRSWQEVLARLRAEPRSSFAGDLASFASAEGFAYFLPAFLIASLDTDDAIEVGETLALKLWTYPQEIAPLLAPAEKRVVVQVLEHLADVWEARRFVRNDARAALDHFWAYFTDAELGLRA